MFKPMFEDDSEDQVLLASQGGAPLSRTSTGELGLIERAKVEFPDEPEEMVVKGIEKIKSVNPKATDDQVLQIAKSTKDQMQGAAPASQIENPLVKDHIQKLYGDKFSNEARQKIVDENKSDASGLQFGASLAALGAGLAGGDAVAAGQSVLKNKQSMRDSKLADFDKQRSNTLQDYQTGRQLKQDVEGDDKLLRESDVNSDESKMAQELAREMGVSPEVAKTLTAARFKEISPVMQKKYEIEQKRLDRAESREMRQTDRDVKIEEKRKLSDKQVGDITSFDKAISAIDDVLAQKETNNWDTGKASFAMNKVAGWVGLDDAKKSAFKSDVGEQLALYIKNISGATVSPTERASLLENVPSVYDNDETFAAKAKATRDRIQRNRDLELENIGKSGKNVEAFKTVPKESSGYPKQLRKDGKVATISNADEEANAKAKGWS